MAEVYLSLWNEADDSKRSAILEKHWAVGAQYTDPLMKGRGREEIAALIQGARPQFPGHAFSVRGTPDGHGSYVRFSWTLAPKGGAPVGGGTDVVRWTKRAVSVKSSDF